MQQQGYDPIGGFHVTSLPPCWWTVNKRSLISSFCLSTSICSFHHCYLCLPRLHENHLFTTSFVYHRVETRLLESQVEAEELNQSQSVGMNIVLGLSFYPSPCSDSSDSNSIVLMTPLTTPIFSVFTKL